MTYAPYCNSVIVTDNVYRGQIVYDKGQIVYIEAGCFKTGERGSIAPRKSTKSQEI